MTTSASELGAQLDETCEYTSASAENIRRNMDQQEMRSCIREFVYRLPLAYAEILALSEFEDLTNPEIAARLKISVDAAKIRLHRARAALKRELELGCEVYHTPDNTVACDRRHPCACDHTSER